MGRKNFILLLIVFALVLTQANFAPPAQAADPPKHIHLTWQRDDTAHTIVVTWKTATAEAGDKVLYDTQSRGGDPTLYRYSATGDHHTYEGANGYIHDVELFNLKPDTVYYFVCGGETGGWSAERRFRTAPDRGANLSLIHI